MSLQVVPDAAAELAESTPRVRAAAATLPPDLAREGARRLRYVGWAAITANLFWVTLNQLAPVPGMSVASRMLGLAASAFALAFALLVIRLSSSRRLDAQTILDLALIFEVAYALLISVGSHTVPLTAERARQAWSSTAVWVLCFPLVIPNTRKKVILATIATAAMDPVGVVVNAAVGTPIPSASVLLLSFAPTVLGAVIGIVVSGLIFRISVEASRARELGSYRLVEPLGSGGMGEVWRAEHRMLARPAAIKLIRADGPSGGASRELQRRFEREARATARLSSPHTVQIYDYGTTEEGTFYYVMELLDGFDLDTLVRKYGPVPPERAVHLLHQACLSLAEAHERGFTHRDIKPANIYVCHYGIQYDFVKILDFGLVKSGGVDAVDGTLTAVGTIAGTPGYMAPETAVGRETDWRADIYSLGCVGYWLVTGRPVFEKESAVELLIEHARTPPPLPSERTKTPLPAELENALVSCLEKNPNDRPQTAEDLAAALERVPLVDPWTPARARRWWLEHPAARLAAEEKTVAVEDPQTSIRRVGPAG